MAILTLFLLEAGALSVNLSSANFFPAPGPDLPRIYIRNDGSIEPETASIERTGNIYTLTGNVVHYTIEIQRDNIVLDGVGYSILGNISRIKGYDDGNNGVIVAGRNNVTITRLNFEQGDTGVRISGSSNIAVIDNTFSNGITTGVATEDSSFVSIVSNNFTSIYGPDILCNGATNTIKGNTLTDGAYGIKLEGAANIVSDNKIEILLPIMMDNADSNVIARNEISGPPLSLAHWPDRDQNFTGNEGISLFTHCSNNIIFQNNLTGFVNQAIRLVDGSNNTVYDNYFANNQFAIALGGFGSSVNNTFYGNTFAADSCKVQIDEADGTFWDNGTLGNYWGDYNGTDGNGDGIGDAPYIVNGYKWDTNVDGFVSFVSGQDNYPLMTPFEAPSAPTSSPNSQSSSEPFSTSLAISSVITVAVFSVGMLYSFKKRK
jgi:parallel beta-helix repeat protein